MGGYVGLVDRASDEILNAEEIAINLETVRRNAISEALTTQQRELANLFDIQTITVLAQIREERGEAAFQIQLDAERILAEQRQRGALSPGVIEVLDTARQVQILNIIAQQQGIVDPARQTPTLLETLFRLTGALTQEALDAAKFDRFQALHQFDEVDI